MPPTRLHDLTEAAGLPLDELIFEPPECSNVADLKPVLEAVEENCVALRRLDIYRPSVPLSIGALHATRGRFKQLTFDGRDAGAIDMYCPGLLKLRLFLDYSSFVNSENNLGILRTFGPTLESLSSSCFLTSEELDEARSLCPKLTNICLGGHNGPTCAAYPNFLGVCSYGSQLRFANLAEIQKAHCENVMTSCPIVRHFLDLKPPVDRFLSKMKVVGPRLKRLSVRVSPN